MSDDDTAYAILVEDEDGEYWFEIVGEASYQDALDAIAGPKAEDGVQRECLAALVPEADNPYDANAVAVYVSSQKVGYLKRDDAPVFRAFVAKHLLSNHFVFARAMITGGWLDDDSEGFYGLFLNIMWPPEVDRQLSEL